MAFKIPDTPEELFRQGNLHFPPLKPWLAPLIILLIISGIALTSFYSISSDGGEVGVITRFGKYNRTTLPGLHWKLPFNIERLYVVKVENVFKEEFGFRTERAGVRTQYSTSSFDDESLMLTGDLNVLEVTWIVQFRVKDPVKLLFNIRNPRETVRDVSEAVMRQVIGDSSVTEALTTRRIEINEEVQQKMQEILDQYQSGVHITTVKLQTVVAPDEVRPSFNEVNEAEQEKEKVINQAREAYNKAIPQAKGEAEKTISEAQGYALRRINQAQGDALRFTQVWNAYKSAKEVTRRRMYLETLGDILPQAGPKYIVDPQGNGILPLLRLEGGGKKNE